MKDIVVNISSAKGSVKTSERVLGSSVVIVFALLGLIIISNNKEGK